MPCEAGKGPNAERTGCQPCTGAREYSILGQCNTCEVNKLPSEDRTQCLLPPSCPSKQLPVGLGCGCADNYYNASAVVVVCFSYEYTRRAVTEATRFDRSDPCEPCPPCLTGCAAGDSTLNLTVRKNFAWRHEGNYFQVFPCAGDGSDGASNTCDGASNSPLGSASCPVDRKGPLCHSCAIGYSKRGSECKPCAQITSDLTKSTVALLVCASILLPVLLWPKLVALHVARLQSAGVFGSVKVFIGFSQVAVLFTGVSSNFELSIGAGSGISSYDQVLDVVSVNIPALVNLHCYSVSFYTKWIARAIGLPLLLFAAVACKSARDHRMSCCVKASLRATWSRSMHPPSVHADDQLSTDSRRRRAKLNLMNNTEIAFFTSYASIFSSVLEVMSCRKLGEHESVLEADYTVSCLTPEYEDACFVAKCLSVLLVTFPVWMLWDAFRVNSYRADKMHHEYRESCEYFEAVDFLRKVAILCCAWLGNSSSVARPVYAALVSLGFSFVQIRVWPYRRSETNVLKAASDFTIFFVFFMCSLSASKNMSAATGTSSENEDQSLQLVRTVIVSMWRVGVPTLSVLACTLSSWRFYARLKAGSQELNAGLMSIRDDVVGQEQRPTVELRLEALTGGDALNSGQPF